MEMNHFKSMPTASADSAAVELRASPKYQKVPGFETNNVGQAMKLYLCSCKATQIVTFHITWITFWLCFFVWFCTANIYHEEISNDLNITVTQHQLGGALSITSTIFFRVIISDLCYRFGSRVSYVIVLICTALSLVGIGLIQSLTGYLVFHIFLGIAGASFVVTQYHTTRMFSGEIVGAAQAMTAGFGNFGGGCANFFMPLLTHAFPISWRWYMIIFAVITFIFAIIYYFATNDTPQDTSEDEKLPDKQIGGAFKDAATDYRTWILFLCYGACFGVEITFYLVAAHFFQIKYGLNEISSGLLVMIWSSMNIFARPLGGHLSGKYNMIKRVKILFVLLFLQSICLILFGFVAHESLGGAIVISLLFSICVQMAEGVTFSITPFIQPKSVGHVIGIVGSGGNFGATVFMFVLFIPWGNSELDPCYAWVVLGVIVMIIAFVTLTIKFTERELHDLGQTIQECYDLTTIQTTIIKKPKEEVLNNV